MSLPNISRRVPLLICLCLVTCFGLNSSLEAQTSAGRSYQSQERVLSSHYQPRFMRRGAGNRRASFHLRGRIQEDIQPQQAPQPTMADDPSPTVSGGAPVVGAPVEEVIVGDGGYIDGGCDGCGGAYLANGSCNECGPLYDPRDCGVYEDCWLGGLSGLYCNSEFFAGVQGFKHQQFADPQGLPQPENDSFGFHWGVNTGLPLYRLTCGLVSGQVGVNFVNSNLEDGVFATGDRQQTFVTIGLFRRVDCGLQFGTVADILHEEFVSTLDIVQMRSELSWVWANGSNFGFRWTDNVQDDSGFVGGTFLPRIDGQAIDTYRLFYRHACCNAGYVEWFVGSSDEDHTIFGTDFDVPMGDRMALYASFNYLSPDESLPLTDNEAWNIQLGMSFRPRGRDWYKFYHRPLFKVADNGSMVLSRRP